MSIRMFGVMCQHVSVVVVGSVRMLVTSLQLNINLVPSLIFLSLPFLAVGGGLVGKVLLSEKLSYGNQRGRGWRRIVLCWWHIIN